MTDKINQAFKTMADNLKKNTGKSLDQWVDIVKKIGDKKHGEVVSFLKTKHALGHGFANMIAHSAKGGVGENAPPDDQLLDSMFSGDKSGLLPTYKKLIKACQGFGKDVEISPKKTYVSLRRAKQFALVQPTTKTRLDIGIKLSGVAPTARLEPSGSFNAMVTHRVRLESAGEIDKELLGWLKAAYESAA